MYNVNAALAQQLLSHAIGIKRESNTHVKSESNIQIKTQNNVSFKPPQSNAIKTENPFNVEMERKRVIVRDIKLDENPYLSSANVRNIKSEANHNIPSPPTSAPPPPMSRERTPPFIYKYDTSNNKQVPSKRPATAQKKAKKKKNKKKSGPTPENSRKRWTEAHDRSLLKWMRKNRNDLHNQARIKGKAQHLGRTMIALTARINLLKKKMDDPPKSSKKKTKSAKKQKDDAVVDDVIGNDADEWLPSDDDLYSEDDNNTNNNNKKRKKLSNKERKALDKKQKPVLDLVKKLKEIHQFQGLTMSHIQRILYDKHWSGDVNTLEKYVGCDLNALQSQWEIMKNCVNPDIAGDKLLANSKKLAKRKRRVIELLQADKVYEPQNKRRRIN